MFKSDKAQENIQRSIEFILVGTTHPGNIGAAARAMKNMGITRLSLVSPKEFPSKTAFYRSKAASDILERAKVFTNLEEAVTEAELVIGTSVRNRKIPWPIISPREAAKKIIDPSLHRKKKIVVIFGREDRGLTNEELGLCNLHVHIPSSDEYPSLNIAQAVQILAYEIRLAILSTRGNTEKQVWDVPLAKNSEIEYLIKHFNEVMQEVGFYEENNPRQLLTRVRRFFKRSNLDHMEANIFRGVFAAIQKKLKE